MTIKDIIRLPQQPPDIKIELREVVRDVGKKPHVFVRVRLRGWHFPERALEPFMIIGDEVSKFVLLTSDGSIADAYFDKHPPRARRVSFGYGNIISWDFDVSVNPSGIARLDRTRLVKGIIDLRD